MKMSNLKVKRFAIWLLKETKRIRLFFRNGALENVENIKF